MDFKLEDRKDELNVDLALRRRDVMALGFASVTAVALAGSAESTPSNAFSSLDDAGAANVSNKSADVQVIFVDLQPDLVGFSKTVSPHDLEIAAAALAEAATLLNWPMLFCLAPQAGHPASLLGSLDKYAHSGNTISRTIINPFGTTAVLSAIEANRRRTLVVSGFTAETAIVLTSLAALERGLKVFVPVDVVGSRVSARTEAAALREIERAGAIVTSVRSFVQRHLIDATVPPGPAIAKAIGRV